MSEAESDLCTPTLNLNLGDRVLGEVGKIVQQGRANFDSMLDLFL